MTRGGAKKDRVSFETTLSERSPVITGHGNLLLDKSSRGNPTSDQQLSGAVWDLLLLAVVERPCIVLKFHIVSMQEQAETGHQGSKKKNSNNKRIATRLTVNYKQSHSKAAYAWRRKHAVTCHSFSFWHSRQTQSGNCKRQTHSTTTNKSLKTKKTHTKQKKTNNQE